MSVCVGGEGSQYVCVGGSQCVCGGDHNVCVCGGVQIYSVWVWGVTMCVGGSQCVWGGVTMCVCGGVVQIYSVWV